MGAWVAEYYPWIKALHVIAVIAWMAGLLYLPRLFVYHTEAPKGSGRSEMLKVMERRLLRGIMNPALIAVLVLGLALISAPGVFSDRLWLHIKLLLVIGLIAMHMLMAVWRKDFEADRNTRPARFFRMINEVPTVLMIAIVILVIVKPL